MKTNLLTKINLLIGNEDVETEHYTEVKDPGRLSDVIGEVAEGTPEDVDRAVKNSHQAYLSWKEVSLQDRISLVLKIVDVLEEEKPFLAELISKQNGMLLEMTKAEINMCIANIKNTVGFADSFFAPKVHEDETSRIQISHKPMGVIAGIVPWNAPLVLTMQKLVPAIISGNTIVIKPSPFASMGTIVTLKKIASIFPSGVINVVTGEGDVGAALTSHPLISKVSFTGGGNTAKHIMKSAADSLKGVHFELGGNDPAIILKDANVDEIIPEIVQGVFRRSGQFCYAIKRIYVPEEIYDAFYEKMCEETNKLKVGHQLDAEATLGPVNNQQQYESIKQLIEKVEETDAKLVQLGEKLDPDNWENGYYLQPSIVRDIDPDHELVTTEQFGPIIPLIKYQTVDEVIEMANSTEYGLGSTVWSSNEEEALRVADRIESGFTFINTAFYTPLAYKYTPISGVKQSGIGRENSEMIFDEYTETHAITLKFK